MAGSALVADQNETSTRKEKKRKMKDKLEAYNWTLTELETEAKYLRKRIHKKAAELGCMAVDIEIGTPTVCTDGDDLRLRINYRLVSGRGEERSEFMTSLL